MAAGWQVAPLPGHATISAGARSHHADRALRRGTSSCRYRCRSPAMARIGLLRHGVLFVFAAPGQILLLAGLEHGRTIPLRDVVPFSFSPRPPRHASDVPAD